jgi:signal transduction histidine kinase
MRELALHILDLIENSIRAQATIIAVSVAADPAADRLRIVIEDNGTGLKVSPEAALDPFYTTKSGKRTGLGLSLFRAAAESTGGRLMLGRSGLGGVQVAAELGLRHIDRSPLGDLAGTLSSVVCTNPDIDFRFRIRLGEHECRISAFEVAEELGEGRGGLAVARRVAEKVQASLESCGVLI